MAVPTYKRGFSKFRVITVCDEITEYLLHMVCNEKIFPKKMRWILAGKIADLVNDFHSCVWTANEIQPDSIKAIEERLFLQNKAKALMVAIETKLRIAYTIFQLDVNKFEHIAKLFNEEEKLISGWSSSDRKKLAEIQGNVY